MSIVDDLKVDRSSLEIVDLEEINDAATDLDYWLSKTQQERLAGIEVLRQAFYDYDPDTERLQRVLEIIDLQ